MNSDYTYTAVDGSGSSVSGTISAASEEQAAAMLQQRGLVPLRIAAASASAASTAGARPVKTRPRLNKSINISFGRRAAGTKELVTFTQDLAALLEAGVPLARSLKIMTELVEKKRFRAVIEDLYEQIKQGSTFWQALEKHPAEFSAVFIHMVKAGEAGGVLDQVLQRLGIYLDSAQELKEYLLSAIVYPVFLLITSAASIVVLLAVVVPKFSAIFADMGVALPASTRLMMSVGDFIKHDWYLIIAAAVAVYFSLRAYARSDSGGYNLDRLKLRLPLIGSIVRRLEISRFCRTFSTLLASGIPILKALQMVRGLLGNRVLAASIDKVYHDLKQGEVLSEALAAGGQFPAMAVQMIAIGEETGRMDKMLARIADMYDRELKVNIKAFTSLFEPLIILVMGLVIGAMVISMLLAIFSINDMGM